MARGDIVLVELPQPTGSAGHEQFGKRPALIIHDDSTSSVVSVIMIIPFTSNISVTRFPHTILVQPSPENGLDVPSVLEIFQLRAIDKRRLSRKLGNLEAAIMTLVENEMRSLLGL
jgi:mRNA interferase MazF